MAARMVLIVRGTFRLVLALAVAAVVAFTVLSLSEFALKRGLLGIDHMSLVLVLAMALGVASAVAIDRLWIKVRALGPTLSQHG
jgi:hypothetical protein